MVNKYKTGNEATYRVVGLYRDDIFVKRVENGVANAELGFIAGPYANEGVAKGQCTQQRNAEKHMLENYGIESPYERIFVQVSYPAWEELDH